MDNLFRPFLFAFPAAGFACLAPVALADKARAPHSYVAFSDDMAFELVMNVPGDTGADPRRNGLYPRGSSTPLWTVDWHAERVVVLNDGIHLVRRGPWTRSIDDEAFGFFANGRELASYRVRELISSESGLEYTASHIDWLSKWDLDERAMRLRIETLAGDEHEFDLRTGRIVGSVLVHHDGLKP